MTTLSRFTIIMTMTALLSACASGIMQGYVGKDINEAIMDYGPPDNIIELSDGRRAYQLVRGKTTTLPSMSHTTTHDYGNAGITGQTTGNRFNASVNTSGTSFSNTINSGSTTVEGRCVYTLIARFHADNKTWIVEDFRKPSLICE